MHTYAKEEKKSRGPFTDGRGQVQVESQINPSRSNRSSTAAILSEHGVGGKLGSSVSCESASLHLVVLMYALDGMMTSGSVAPSSKKNSGSCDARSVSVLLALFSSVAFFSWLWCHTVTTASQ